MLNELNHESCIENRNRQTCELEHTSSKNVIINFTVARQVGEETVRLIEAIFELLLFSLSLSVSQARESSSMSKNYVRVLND